MSIVMANNQPTSNSPSTEERLSPEVKIAGLQSSIKSENTSRVYITVIGVALPAILLMLKYMGAISIPLWASILLWVLLIFGILMNIGVSGNISELESELSICEAQKIEDIHRRFKAPLNNPELGYILTEHLKNIERQNTNIQKLHAQSSVFFTALAVSAMLLGTAAILIWSSKQEGIGHYIYLASSLSVAFMGIFAYFNHQRRLSKSVIGFQESAESLEYLVNFFFLFDLSKDSKDKDLMIEKMVNDFLYDEEP